MSLSERAVGVSGGSKPPAGPVGASQGRAAFSAWKHHARLPESSRSAAELIQKKKYCTPTILSFDY